MHAQAGHALIGALMPEYDPVAKISIVPRGAAGGLTFFSPSEERLESGLYRCCSVAPSSPDIVHHGWIQSSSSCSSVLTALAED